MKQQAKLALVILLMFAMALSFVACGDKTPEITPEDVPTARESASEPTQEPDPGIDLSGRAVVDAGFFSVAYPDEWSYDADKASISERSANLKFTLFGEDKEEQYALTIDATKDSAARHRNPFTRNGIDLRDLAAGNLDFVTVDRTAFYNSGDRTPYYRYRHDPSGVNYYIRLETKEDADFDAPPVLDIMQGIKLKLTDDGETPTPWPWDGERWTPTLSPQMAGTFTLTPVYLPVDEPIISTTFLDSSFTVVGDMIYVVADNDFCAYRMSGDKITLEKAVKLDKEYNKIRSDSSGKLYLSPRMGKVDVYDGFTQIMATDAKATLVMHPSGGWGINFWVASDTEKITLQDGVFKSEPWVIQNMNKDGNTSIFSQLRDIRITDSHIIVTGALTDKDDVGVKIVIYDHNGKEKLVLQNTKEDRSGLGSVTGVVETPNGFFATDGNLRDIALWTSNGTFIGKVDVKQLFGASYCWLEDLYRMDDGSILIMISQERDDKSADELLFFKVTGF